MADPFSSSLSRVFGFNKNTATGTTINSVILTRDGIDISASALPAISTSTPNFDGSGAGDAAGVYVMPVIDSSSETTQVSWQCVDLSLSFSAGPSSYQGSGAFSRDITVSAEGTLPISTYKPNSMFSMTSTGQTKKVQRVSVYDSGGNSVYDDIAAQNNSHTATIVLPDTTTVFLASSTGHTDLTG